MQAHPFNSAHAQGTELQRIDFSSLPGICVGNAQDDAGATGVTVFRFSVPARAAVSVFGGGPASRETESLAPERNHPLNALVFSGGSAYGLSASGGVARSLEEHGVGFDTGIALVPIVCQSCIYDLGYGSAVVRPDERMGWEACENSFSSQKPGSGNVGAGTGATVGKAAGMRQAQKAGIGYAAFQLGNLQVGVALVLNSYGDVYFQGKKLAGMLTPDRSAWADSFEALLHTAGGNLFTSTTNTTLAAVFTNADLSPAELKQVTQMASCGLARGIHPVFTTADGDTVYALSVGPDEEKVSVGVDIVGALSAALLEEAIVDAVQAARLSEDEFRKQVNY